ncbi:MAG: hypothetical protein GX994_00885 [Firmicutes bacterium]|nr:hypothetical protein [Bacillota bacterium]
MKNSINILHFDDVYLQQTFYKASKVASIDLTDLKNVSRFCELSTLQIIARRLKQAHNSISFIGNGNHHYVTLLFLAKVPVPFTLVLFDHHTDMAISPSESLVSCGSWVTKALHTIPQLKKVILVGTADELANEIPPLFDSKVIVFTQKQVKRYHWLKYSIGAAVPTKVIYVSIDKDVLSKTEAVTNWDQGDMTLTQLLSILYYLGTIKHICGMDVSGEYATDPVIALNPTTREFARKNSHANKALLQTSEKITRQAG